MATTNSSRQALEIFLEKQNELKKNYDETLAIFNNQEIDHKTRMDLVQGLKKKEEEIFIQIKNPKK